MFEKLMVHKHNNPNLHLVNVNVIELANLQKEARNNSNLDPVNVNV